MTCFRFFLFALVAMFVVTTYKAQAGICSLLLFPQPYVKRESPFLYFSPYTADRITKPFYREEEAWFRGLVGQSQKYLGDRFPAPLVTVQKSVSVSDTAYSYDSIQLADVFVQLRMDAIVLHEWGHALFVERLKQDSRFILLFDQLDQENQNKFEELRSKGRRPSRLNKVGLQALGNQMVKQFFILSLPYQELFADLHAVLITKNPLAMVEAIELYGKLLDQQLGENSLLYDNANLYRDDFHQARGFSGAIPFEEIEKTRFFFRGDFDLGKKERWDFAEHHILAGSRPLIWNRLLKGSLNHSEDEVRRVMDLVYRISLEEIFYRFKRPWLWRLAPQEIRQRFNERIIRAIESKSTF